MSDELKPCPFCTNPYKAEYRNRGMWHFVICGCCGSRTGNWYSKDQAVEAWNTREERTCNLEPIIDNWESDCDRNSWECSECGELSYISNLCQKPNYCPNCGAKVVD